MNIKLLILTLSIMLSGCMYQTADNIDIAKAAEFCSGVENIDEIVINFTGTEIVHCIDGTRKSVRNISLPKGKSK